MEILLGITGSVATVLVPKLCGNIIAEGHELQIVATEPAMYFLPPGSEKGLQVPYMRDIAGTRAYHIHRDKEEWPAGGYHKNDPVKHIEFRNDSDVLVIAPLTANTLAKIANGIADNFLTCIVRAWQKEKPLVLAPAMNTVMWEDPITEKQLRLLHERFKILRIVYPVSKALACGDVGDGAMADIRDIIAAVNLLR